MKLKKTEANTGWQCVSANRTDIILPPMSKVNNATRRGVADQAVFQAFAEVILVMLIHEML